MSNEVDFTEEDINKFFESGGEEVPESFKAEESSEETSEQQEQQQEQQASEEQSQEAEQEQAPDFEAIQRERDNYKKAMDAERIQRKELQQKYQTLEERLGKLNEKISEKQQPQEPQYDYEENPLEYTKAQLEQMQKRQQEYDEYIRKQQETAKAQQEFQQFASTVAEQEQAYAKENPDYYDAHKFLRAEREKELKLMRFPKEEINNIIMQDEAAISQMALSRNENPAEIVYELAAAKGFQPKQQQEAQEAQKKLENIEKGSSMSKSLGSTRGEGGVELSLDSVADMSDEEFNKLLDDDNWEKMIGAR